MSNSLARALSSFSGNQFVSFVYRESLILPCLSRVSFLELSGFLSWTVLEVWELSEGSRLWRCVIEVPMSLTFTCAGMYSIHS